MSAGALNCPRLGHSGCRVKPRRLEAASASHDSPRTPNVNISGPGGFKYHQNSTKVHRNSEEKMKIMAGEGKKSEILGGPGRGRSGEGSFRGEGGLPHTQHKHNTNTTQHNTQNRSDLFRPNWPKAAFGLKRRFLELMRRFWTSPWLQPP